MWQLNMKAEWQLGSQKGFHCPNLNSFSLTGLQMQRRDLKESSDSKKTMTFIYWFIRYTFHDIAIYYWQRYYNAFAFLYINTKSEVGPQRLMILKINKCISHLWYSYIFFCFFLHITHILKHIICIIYSESWNQMNVMGCWRHVSISIGSCTSHRTHGNMWHYSSN